MPAEHTEPRSFVDVSLRGAAFRRVDLSGAVMRAMNVDGLEIDAPWLLEGDGSLVVNGVDVVPFVRAELERRFPGRASLDAAEPEALRRAWAEVEAAWAAAVERAAAMPEGTVDVSVAGEWSFAETLRHLVMATDTWLRRAVQRVDEPYHPIGVAHAEYATDGHDTSIFQATPPSFDEVLTVRAQRQQMVHAFLDEATDTVLDEPRSNPWGPEYPETVRSCIQTILGEEWEHLRYAVRDLDVIEAEKHSA